MVYAATIDRWNGSSLCRDTTPLHRTDDYRENLLHSGARTLRHGIHHDRLEILPISADASLLTRTSDGITFHSDSYPYMLVSIACS